MTTEQFFKYAVEMCQNVATTDVRNVKLCLEGLHVGILLILIFLRLNE